MLALRARIRYKTIDKGKTQYMIKVMHPAINEGSVIAISKTT
jgi:hypothetical protein